MSSQEQQRPSSGGMSPRSGGPVSPLSTKNPPCPTCERRMTVKQVTPVLFASGLDDVIYGCEKCGAEVKRTVKRA
jgi:DNA-directed RNA polymerase subunit RPC12/RpoP